MVKQTLQEGTLGSEAAWVLAIDTTVLDALEQHREYFFKYFRR